MQTSDLEEAERCDTAGPPAQPLAAGKRRLFAALLFLTPLLLGFSGLELYLRGWKRSIDLYDQTGRRPGPNPMAQWAVIDAFSGYRPRPGVRTGGKTVNRHGFISTPEIGVDKPPDTVRLLFLGGSSTAGTGVDLRDEDTWPWKAAERIRQRTGRKIDFINGGAGGYTTFESYGRLWSRLRHFSPDFVVVYHGWNEMYYFDKVDEIVAWRTLPDGTWSFEGGHRVAVHAPLWIDPFLRWSPLLTRIRLGVSRHLGGELAAPGGAAPASGFDPRGPEIFRANLRLLRETSKVIGARLLVAKQATLVVPDAPQEVRALCRVNYHGFTYDAHVKAFQALYDVIDQEIRADSILDMTPLSGRVELFHDHVHPTPEGTTEMARIVADALATLVEGTARP